MKLTHAHNSRQGEKQGTQLVSWLPRVKVVRDELSIYQMAFDCLASTSFTGLKSPGQSWISVVSRSSSLLSDIRLSAALKREERFKTADPVMQSALDFWDIRTFLVPLAFRIDLSEYLSLVIWADGVIDARSEQTCR